jgi:SAM-dependent methyltransferase
MARPMTATSEPPPPDGRPAGPEARLAEIRSRLSLGEPLVGPLATEFHAAVNALDPGATEDALSVLPGNGGVQLYASLVSWASLAPGERVLDLGCGTGGAAREAARAVGAEGLVIGVDPVPEALALARERTPADLPIVYRQGRAERLAHIPDRSLDCVLASLVFEQVADLDAALLEIVRVLRPGGRLVASVTAFDRLRPLDARLMGSVLAVVAVRARGALAGRASRASIPHEASDAAAFRAAGLLTPEERDVQLAAVMEDADGAWALFSRSLIAHLLDEEGREELRARLARRVPHTLYIPLRFLRTRRPG